MERKKKLIVIISGAAIMLAAMVAMAVVAFSPNGNTASPSIPSSASPSPPLTLRETRKMVKSFCAPTLHRRDCEQTLLPIIGNSTDVKQLVNTTFHVAFGRVHDSLSHASLLLAAEKDPNSQKALKVCKEVLSYGIDDLQRTIDRYESFKVAHADRIIDDAKTWLSGALTYQHTCLDAFDKSGSPAGIDMAKALNRSISFTANGLNIVSEMERMTSGLQLGRKLLASENPTGYNGLPGWVSFGERRLLDAEIVEIKPNATVAQDGSGDFVTITEALATVPKKSRKAFVIHIKEGVYKEKVVVNRSLTNVVFIGDGPDKTKISGELNAVDGVKTFHTATFAVMGDGFMARDMGFENTAGPAKHQAVAVRVQSDMTIFHNCRMDGYQDTLYDFTYRHFYRDCAITGTVDFVFGNAKSVFQNCTLLLRRPLPSQHNVVTAHASRYADESTAFVLHNCTVEADLDYADRPGSSYLGRPWQKYARTVVMQSRIGEVIKPEGWMAWEEGGVAAAADNVVYAEYDNRGPGADTAGRVKWKGVKTITEEEALQFLAGIFINGDVWVQPAGVPYTLGLLPAKGRA